MPKRTPDQCRTHHQKMHTKYHGDMDEIIREVKSKIMTSLRKKLDSK